VRLEANLAGRGGLGLVDLDLESVLRVDGACYSCRSQKREQDGAHARDRTRPRRPRRARARLPSCPKTFRFAHSAVPRTGVIYVTAEAYKRGFRSRDPTWVNLGQGQPETGELPGAPPRVLKVPVDLADQDYAPVAGIWELRESVAALYNRL